MSQHESDALGRIAEAVIDQPGTKETQKVKKIAGLAGRTCGFSGKATFEPKDRQS